MLLLLLLPSGLLHVWWFFWPLLRCLSWHVQLGHSRLVLPCDDGQCDGDLPEEVLLQL